MRTEKKLNQFDLGIKLSYICGEVWGRRGILQILNQVGYLAACCGKNLILYSIHIFRLS